MDQLHDGRSLREQLDDTRICITAHLVSRILDHVYQYYAHCIQGQPLEEFKPLGHRVLRAQQEAERERQDREEDEQKWQLSAAHSFSQQRWRGGSRCVVGVWWSAWSMLTLCAVKCVFEKISLSTGHASITTVPPLHSTLSRAQLRGQPAAAQHQRVTRQTAHSLSSCASLSLLWPAGHRGAAASRPPRYRLSSSELCHLR